MSALCAGSAPPTAVPPAATCIGIAVPIIAVGGSFIWWRQQKRLARDVLKLERTKVVPGADKDLPNEVLQITKCASNHPQPRSPMHSNPHTVHRGHPLQPHAPLSTCSAVTRPSYALPPCWLPSLPLPCETLIGRMASASLTGLCLYACMYVCMYDYIAVSTRTLTPPTTGTD